MQLIDLMMAIGERGEIDGRMRYIYLPEEESYRIFDEIIQKLGNWRSLAFFVGEKRIVVQNEHDPWSMLDIIPGSESNMKWLQKHKDDDTLIFDGNLKLYMFIPREIVQFGLLLSQTERFIKEYEERRPLEILWRHLRLFAMGHPKQNLDQFRPNHRLKEIFE
ncbi:MAG: hypothetical protein UT24_C0011G0017 [Candidatus Woesebacteria bacterium GW2011_GWB1_39_12]|uniref:Uncharacterized protein n=1 Tax=Candidatus Woesebacteria bacterium GW2011_GWB1_39_12 TaxID=1618574 RepID=A0A0G0M8V0_9BACT|nr:MAG: hypothetical protein UT24_C0011G0017 [Candidatus Woesebacteria bacterium GW2011_GWB1_39_12]